MPAVLAVLRGRLDDLAKLMDTEPGAVDQCFPDSIAAKAADVPFC